MRWRISRKVRSIGCRAGPVPIPWGCADGFFEAYWRWRVATGTNRCAVQYR